MKIETSARKSHAGLPLLIGELLFDQQSLAKSFSEAYLEEFLVSGAAVEDLLDEDLLIWVREL